MQLFADIPEKHHIPIPDGELYLVRHFYPAPVADSLFQSLYQELQWQAKTIKIFGREVMQPRLMAWYGEADAVYTYSGTTFAPIPFTPTLLRLKTDIETFTGAHFNSALANLYRHGQDSMGWHSDDEPELGNRPLIASISFGVERVFKLRHKKDKTLKIDLPLPHGSLLVMRGAMQHYWQHALPKTAKPIGPRINLTFRQVFTIT